LVAILFEGGLQTPQPTRRRAWRGTILALVTAFVARPLATFPVIDHVGRSVELFDLVFFAVLVSTLLRGATVAPLAKLVRKRT